MKQLVYTREALRTLDRLPLNVSLRIREKLRLYIVDPEAQANNVRALRGVEGLLRMRIGDWRVLFTDSGDVVRIVRVAPRGSAYDQL